MQVGIYCKDLGTGETYSYDEFDNNNKKYKPNGWIEERFCDNPITFNLFMAKRIINQAKETDTNKSQYEYYIKPIKEH